MNKTLHNILINLLRYSNLFSFIILFYSTSSYGSFTLNWQILSNNQIPISGALVTIYNQNKSLKKTLSTDSEGYIPKQTLSSTFSPWSMEISAPNFITKIILDVQKQGADLNIYLRKEITESITLKGKTSGFKKVRKDGLVDFGLTILSLNLSEIWNINPTNFFSTKIVTVPTFKKIKIPSNLTLPNQKERYWISVRLKKETYELNVPKKKKYIAHTLHGQFPLKQAIKKIQGGNSFISLANLFKFKAYSSEEIDFTEKTNTSVNFDLSKNTIDGDIKVQANIDTKIHEIVLLSLLKKQTQYLPFDIKRLIDNSSTKLSIPEKGLNKNVLGLLTEKGIEKLTSKKTRKITSIILNNIPLNNLDSTLPVQTLTSTAGIKLPYLPPNLGLSDLLTKHTSLAKKIAKTQSKFLTAQRLSIAIQTPINNQVTLKFLPLIKKPIISSNYIQVSLPKITNSFQEHSSILQLVEMQEIFLDKSKKHKILVTKVLEEVGLSQWITQFNSDFIHRWKKDPKKRYGVQVIFLASSNQLPEPSHATRSLQEILD